MLDPLFSTLSLDAFLSTHYLCQPVAIDATAGFLSQYAQWDSIENVLASSHVDYIISRDGKQWADAKSPNATQIRDLVNSGHTLCIRHAELHDSGLATIADGFREIFQSPVDIHIYCTPANTSGLNWHYDVEEVFVVQTCGRKHWKLRKNTVNPWPILETMPNNLRFEREITPSYSCTLGVGDWLYIPSGYWHRTQAHEEESISLSIGIRAPTAIDLYDFLRRRIINSLRWKQRLPLPQPASTELDKERLEDLMADLSALIGTDFLSEFRKWHTSAKF